MGAETSALRMSLGEGIPKTIPEPPVWDDAVDHAPPRRQILTPKEKKLALRNALRYFPESQHEVLSLITHLRATRLLSISYAVFCLKKKKTKKTKQKNFSQHTHP